MPSTKTGRDLVQRYCEENEISIGDLAKMYGMTKSNVSDYLSGKLKGPAANRFILKVIHDFKI